MTEPKALPSGPLVAFYGDDFTGSSAAMEVLAFAGLETILFLEPPTPGRLARIGAFFRGIGIAGVARARSPEWMDTHLPSIFDLLKKSGAPIIHYKVCSTFDSAPHIGSIGRAAEIGSGAIGGWIPMVVSDPGVGRFQAFGHLFAHADGVGYRLDRHPTMAAHPVTPMTESDLGSHLGAQTALEVGLVDFVTMKRGGADALLQREVDAGARIVSLDVLDTETLQEAGRLIWEREQEQQFVLGSQGIQQALVAHWRKAGLLPPPSLPAALKANGPIAIVSGSVSPVTAAQIDRAEQDGFRLIRLDAARSIRDGDASGEIDRVTEIALAAVQNGQDPLVYTAKGPQDPAVAAFQAAAAQEGQALAAANDRLGLALGGILNRLVRQGGLRRVIISGGDTSGQAASRLGIDALTAIAPLAPGAPLCRAHSADPAIDGLEIVLKGGQIGGPGMFAAARGN